MISRCNPIARVSALLVLIIALFAIPASAHAQQSCRCDHTTIAVDADVNCDIDICYQLSPRGPLLCIHIPAGAKAQIPCPVYQASIITCDGSYVIIDDNPATAICTPTLRIPRLCCVRACHGLDAAGCQLVTISAVPCISGPCQ
jgi:hypothetical protein